MELQAIGRSGLQVSRLGLGCNNFGRRLDRRASIEVADAAREAGVTFFDTADIYGGGLSEEYLGEALRSHRDDVVIATKFGGRTGEGPYRGGASRKYVMAACEASLRRLGTDYIDLYYQHFPDPLTPVEETLGALSDLMAAGKVRYAGCSNFAGWQVVQADYEARRHGSTRFVVCQSRWSLLRREVEAEVVPACLACGIGVIPYFPLTSGLLTGKYVRGEAPPAGTRLSDPERFASVASDEAFATVDRLAEVAAAFGHTLLEVAVGWLGAQAAVPSVLVGATSPGQVAANAAAVATKLSEEECQAVSLAAGATAPEG